MIGILVFFLALSTKLDCTFFIEKCPKNGYPTLNYEQKAVNSTNADPLLVDIIPSEVLPLVGTEENEKTQNYKLISLILNALLIFIIVCLFMFVPREERRRR
uniref:Transmembrane protein n=1 Tax=Marseillevirus LCMAC101 TaxID=2506602 RepID=A0A481YTC4_9VIRU|nr:MAG: hypothetical protein LCMAC101_03490 [Marseillevirus LCMAC101]